MKKSILATLAIASILTGCSSNGSRSDQSNPELSNPMEAVPTLPVEDGAPVHPIEDDPTGNNPDKPNYNGFQVEKFHDTYYISKNGVELGYMFIDYDDSIMWKPKDGPAVEITKDLVNGFAPDRDDSAPVHPIEDDPTGNNPDKPNYNGFQVEKFHDTYYISKNGVELGYMFIDYDDSILWKPKDGPAIEITKDIVNGFAPDIDKTKLNSLTDAKKDEMKQRVKSLSAEQRQQIRQSVKSRLPVRS